MTAEQLKKALSEVVQGEPSEVLLMNVPVSVEQAADALNTGGSIRVWGPRYGNPEYPQRDGADVTLYHGVIMPEFLIETTSEQGGTYIYPTL